MDGPEKVIGYTFTHWDCPNCQREHQIEGDADGDECECDECQTKIKIERL